MAIVPLFWKLTVVDMGELRDWTEPGLLGIEDPHVTLLYLGGKGPAEAATINGVSIEELQGVHGVLENMAGSEVSFDVTAIFKHSEMIVATVALPDDVPCINGPPYMTLSRSEFVKPVFARDVLRSPASCTVTAISPPMRLRGIVSLESAINQRAAAPGDPTSFVGKILEVQTNPRPSRQTEPSGYATFVSTNGQDVWTSAMRLAESVKAQPAGPPVYKLKARVQAPGKPGHIYLKWAAVAGNVDAREIVDILESRIRELP